MMKILYLVLNDFVNDNRVLRAAKTCLEIGGKPVVFALHREDIPEEENLNGIKVKRFDLITKSWSKHRIIQVIKYAEAVLRMVISGSLLHPDIVHANDINTLPIGFSISRLTKSKLIYDSHELWSDPSHSKILPAWMVKTGLKLERFLSRRANYILTVSERHCSRNGKQHWED